MAASSKSAKAQDKAGKRQVALTERGAEQFQDYNKSGIYANRDLNMLMGQGYDLSEDEIRADLLDKFTMSKGKGGKRKIDYNSYNAAVKRVLENQEAKRKDPRYGMLTKQFTGQDLENDRGYQFRFNQGQNALQSGLAAKGGLFSGAAGKAAIQYGQDFGSNEFQNAYSRDMANKQNLYNMYSGVKSSGQNAAGGMANQFNAIGDIYGTMGANRASGYMGQANALAGGIESGMNYWSQKQAANKPTYKNSNTYIG